MQGYYSQTTAYLTMPWAAGSGEVTQSGVAAVFEFKVDVKVPAEGFLTDEMRKIVDDEVRKMADRALWRVQQVRCPEHQTAPKAVRIVSNSSNGFRLEFTPCCEKLQAAAEKAANDE